MSAPTRAGRKPGARPRFMDAYDAALLEAVSKHPSGRRQSSKNSSVGTISLQAPCNGGMALGLGLKAAIAAGVAMLACSAGTKS